MPPKKGTRSNNPSGRPKGTPNKMTAEVREIIKDLTSYYFNSGEFNRDFKKLEPKDRVTVIERLLKYQIPTLSSIDAKVYNSKEIEDKVGKMTDDQFFRLCDEILETKNEE